MFLQPNSHTFASLDADYSDWHKGRDQFSLWYLEIEDSACGQYLKDLQQQFEPYLYMPNHRQWHITLFVCGFWQAPFHLQHLSDHFHERQLQQQMQLLEQLKLSSFELKLGKVRSFQSALFVEVIDENNGLFCRSGANDRIEPQNFFAGNVRWSHTQTWSGATADET